MIGLAVACTILGGIVGASLEPVSFSVSIPIAIMGGFIMKEIRAKKIQKWIDSHFVEGSVKWEFDGANAIKVTDKTGDSMLVQLSEID